MDKKFKVACALAPLLLVGAIGVVAPGVFNFFWSRFGIDDSDGVASVSLMIFIASCFSIGVGVVVARFGRRSMGGVVAGAICFSLVVLLWPASITISKRPDYDGNVDSGFFVYRAIWRGPYPHTKREDLQIKEIDRFEQVPGWFGETELYILVDASEGAAYGWENIPQYPNATWTESDISDVRSRGGVYSCLNRRERTFGPFTNVELVTPTYHPAAFQQLCSLVSPG